MTNFTLIMDLGVNSTLGGLLGVGWNIIRMQALSADNRLKKDDFKSVEAAWYGAAGGFFLQTFWEIPKILMIASDQKNYQEIPILLMAASDFAITGLCSAIGSWSATSHMKTNASFMGLVLGGAIAFGLGALRELAWR